MSMLEYIKVELAYEVWHCSDRAYEMIKRMLHVERGTGEVIAHARVSDEDASVVVYEVLSGRIIGTMPNEQARALVEAGSSASEWIDKDSALIFAAADSLLQDHHLYFGEGLETDWEDSLDLPERDQTSNPADMIEIVAKMFRQAPVEPEEDIAAFLGIPVADVFLGRVYSNWMNGNASDLSPVVPIVLDRFKAESKE